MSMCACVHTALLPLQARRWVKEAVESGKFKPKVAVAAAAAAAV
jgi:hypothetical protein